MTPVRSSCAEHWHRRFWLIMVVWLDGGFRLVNRVLDWVEINVILKRIVFMTQFCLRFGLHRNISIKHIYLRRWLPIARQANNSINWSSGCCCLQVTLQVVLRNRHLSKRVFLSFNWWRLQHHLLHASAIVLDIFLIDNLVTALAA